MIEANGPKVLYGALPVVFSSLLALLGAREFLYDLTAFPRFELFTPIFRDFGEPTGQFVNAL
jgi:hypothetical protein